MHLRSALLAATAGAILHLFTATVQAQFNYVLPNGTNGTVTITRYTGSGGDVTIPSHILGLPVTTIANGAFRSPSLTSVTLPATITGIGGLAFSNCTSLLAFTVDGANPTFSSVNGVLFNKSLATLIRCPEAQAGSYTIPNSVTVIGNYAFSDCRTLTNLMIPDSVTAIEGLAFSGCTGLTYLTIPGSVISIGERAFSSCIRLTNVTIGNSVTSIGSYAFSGCRGLTNIMIPDSVTSIGGGAFEACTNLTSFTIPNGVASIGGRAFSGCASLTTIAVDAANLAYSSIDGVLFNKSQTTLVQYPEGKPGSYTIPNSVIQIGYYAFSRCTKLTSLAIPYSVTTIGSSAFENCTSLSSVYCQGNAPGLGANVFQQDNVATIYYLSGTTGWGPLFGGRPTALWVQYAYTTNNGTITITGYTGPGGAVTIPPTINGLPVTSIGADAFSGCSSLTNVVIGNSVTSIGDGAFSYCGQVKGFYFDGNAPSLGFDVFLQNNVATIYYAPGTTGWEPTFGGRPTSLWDPLVQCAYSINNGTITLTGYLGGGGNLTIPGTINGLPVTRIGDAAFSGCTRLITVTIPASVTSIGDAGFSGCASLEGVYFQGNAPSLGKDVFFGVNAIAYYLPGTTGWSFGFGGLRTPLWTGPPATLYVSLQSTNPTPPYTNWATAARVIQDAVDAAAPGDEVIVTNGVYASGGRAIGTNLLVNRVAVTKSLKLRSVNGPQFTIILGAKAPGGGNGDGAVRCMYLAEGASLSGFTLTNGATRSWSGGEPEKCGGGVCCEGLTAVVSNCVITGNSANYPGGGVSGGTLNNCTLTGNSAAYGGGAFGSTLYNCTLTGNSSQTGGGSWGSTLYNCVLTANSASGGGGGSQESTLYNCTLTGNRADWAGGGAFRGTLYNCIVYFNQAPLDANYSESVFEYSCSVPQPAGPGNIASDPQLASLTHLASSSPCIGVGSSAYASGLDIDGEAWPLPPSMGADEPVPGARIGPLSMSITASCTNFAVGYPVRFIANITGRITRSVWDFGDGTMLTNQPFARHAWNIPETYTVKLIAFNDSYPEGVSSTVVMQVVREVYYVNTASPTPAPPYSSWATAATNIQDAIDAGTTIGRIVLVTNGNYQTRTAAGVESCAVLRNSVRVESVNGQGLTVIDGGGQMRCAYVGDDSILSGFTLTNGRAVDGGGVSSESLGIVTNCVLTGNSADSRGGGAYGGTLFNCLLIGNSAGGSFDNGSGGGACDAALYNCTLIGNSAGWGGGAAGGELYSCVLTGNSANAGGGAHHAALYNCTVTGNSATDEGGGTGGSFYFGYKLFNCIVYSNVSPRGPNYNVGWVSAYFDHCCTFPIRYGPGNIEADPRLVTASHISSDSPCIGAGRSLYASDVDIDGEVWANPPAIGADQPGLSTGALTMRIFVNLTNVATGYPVPFIALNTGPIVKSVWDFGDGILATNQPFPKHSWTAPGSYTVRLTGYNARHPSGVSTAVTITVGEEVHYVDAASVNPVFPFSSWQTAARNIQEAIGACTLPGRLVLVTNGTYRRGEVELDGINRVALTNRVMVRSVNGPQVTVIEGRSDGVRCAWVGNGSVLSGFTLTRGGALEDGGGAWCSASATVTNCVFTDNSAQGTGGGACGGTFYDCAFIGNSAQYGGGAVKGATLDHCTLTGNSAAWDGGGAFWSTLSNCTLTGNSADRGGGASGSTLISCALVRNSAGGGGGAWASTLNNCTVTGNSADEGGGVYGGTLRRCIVYFNSGSDYASPDGEPVTLEYSCTTPLPTSGVGNIADDPCFVNAAAGDFRLLPNSPCIDAGTNLTGLVSTDLLGLPRPLDGNNDGVARVDMGAYEFNPYRFEPTLRAGVDGFRFTIRGEPGKSVRIERSRDLVHWESAGEVPIPISGQTLIDPAATTEPFLFYRAVVP